MIIKFSDSSKISITEGTIWDYPLPKEDIGISYQEVKGRCPKKGKYLNTVCNEIYFILSGTATFHLRNEDTHMETKDVIIVESNTPHWFETEGLTYITITRPNWFEEQYKTVE